MTTATAQPIVRVLNVNHHTLRDLAQRVAKAFACGDVPQIEFGNLCFQFENAQSAQEFVDAIDQSHARGRHAIILTGFKPVGAE